MIAIRLGLRELSLHARLTIVMTFTVGVPLMCFLFLNALETGLETRYPETNDGFLVAQISGSFGEFFGSRLPASIGTELLNTYASLVIPEIHTVVGTTYENAVLLRGIDLENYSLTNNYQMLTGRPLLPGDPPRLAMLGSRLANLHNILPGDIFQIRGRNFQVVGIFETATYSGNEAWISLQDAQALLGWGKDVSIYLIPDGEILKTGDTLPGGISIVASGNSNSALFGVWKPVFQLLGIVTIFLGSASAIALASILWRMAWLQRHSLAILRSIGFGRITLAAYLLIQAIFISALGFLVGLTGAMLLGSITQIDAAGISIQAIFNIKVILISLLFTAGIAFAGSIVPAWWLNRFNLVDLLRFE